MGYDQLGKLLVGIGATALIVGVLFLLLGRSKLLGRLPGDFTFIIGSFTCIAPIATMLLLSLLLTIILNILLRLRR